MKTYKASEELAKILLSNGFIEITSSRFPDHHSAIVANGYSPQKSKRAFGINSKDFVEFDYTMVRACHKGGSVGSDMSEEFSEDQIKSIIAFFKLPFQSRNAYKRSGSAIPSLYQDYLYMKMNPKFKKEKREILIDAFENVML